MRERNHGNRIPLNRGWEGLIDELRVYNRALSASEIVSLYDQGNSGPFNFSLANSMSLSAIQGSSATNTITASLVSGSPEPVLSRHQGYLQEPVPLSHRKLAAQPVPACLRSRLPHRHLQEPTRSLSQAPVEGLLGRQLYFDREFSHSEPHISSFRAIVHLHEYRQWCEY